SNLPLPRDSFINLTVGDGSLLDKDSVSFLTIYRALSVLYPADNSPPCIQQSVSVPHLGKARAANLGDGNDVVNQTMELQNDCGNPDIGTCREGFVGGNHFRVFLQDGPRQWSCVIPCVRLQQASFHLFPVLVLIM
ncbi:hypothetical protein BJV78DRAFT_1196608, partial [Lactifluus subvellereus]